MLGKGLGKALALQSSAGWFNSTLSIMNNPQKEHKIVWPSQCECGHLYLEKYQLSRLNKKGKSDFVGADFVEPNEW